DEGVSAQRVVKPGQVARVEQDEAESGQRSTDRYAKRVIVQQGDDEVTTQAARNLAAKHGENTAVVKAGPGGELEGLDKLAPTDGKVKVQVVGHGDPEGGKLGGADAQELAGQIKQVKGRLGEEAEVSKVALVGCKTACGTEDQPSLKQQVQAALAKQGTEVGEVKGRDTYVTVDQDGHKHDTDAGDQRALPKPQQKDAANNSTESGDVSEREQSSSAVLDRRDVSKRRSEELERQLTDANGERYRVVAEDSETQRSDINGSNLSDPEKLHHQIMSLDQKVRSEKSELERESSAYDARGIDYDLRKISFDTDVKRLKDKISGMPIKNREFFENIKDGFLTAKIMSNNEIGLDYIAVRIQDDEFTDFKNSQIQGHNNPQAKIKDWYNPIPHPWGLPIAVGSSKRARDITRRDGVDALNVALIPRGQLNETLHSAQADYGGNNTKSWVIFPLRDAIAKGGKLYPDTSAIGAGDHPFIITLPKGTKLDVEIQPVNTEPFSPQRGVVDTPTQSTRSALPSLDEQPIHGAPSTPKSMPDLTVVGTKMPIHEAQPTPKPAPVRKEPLSGAQYMVADRPDVAQAKQTISRVAGMNDAALKKAAAAGKPLTIKSKRSANGFVR
ncbi:C80 family cysteine peptidase, partial [Burkholderia sp. HI2714]|uniref:C80 family cysteine peptidase n=1 Tax=Burkholderia sp. HI2714 TaxID=2015359 RepID=UPI001C532FB2